MHVAASCAENVKKINNPQSSIRLNSSSKTPIVSTCDMSTTPPPMYSLPPIVSHTTPMDLPSTMYQIPVIQGGTLSNEVQRRPCEVRAVLKDAWSTKFLSFHIAITISPWTHQTFALYLLLCLICTRLRSLHISSLGTQTWNGTYFGE